MRPCLMPTLATLAALAAAPLTASAHGGAMHAVPQATTAPVERIQQAWGIGGDAGQIDRTVTVRMNDNMRFSPERIVVRQGETVRFVSANDGGVMHEMVIGTAGALAEHAALMKKFPDMEHEEPWMTHVAPGTQGEVVWTFNRAGRFEFACLIPGHYEAGMVGTIEVTASRLAADSKTSPPNRGKLE